MRKEKQSESYDCPTSLPRDSSQAAEQRREIQIEPDIFSELRRVRLEFRKTKVARIYKEEHWRESNCTEKEYRDLQVGVLKILAD